MKVTITTKDPALMNDPKVRLFVQQIEDKLNQMTHDEIVEVAQLANSVTPVYGGIPCSVGVSYD